MTVEPPPIPVATPAPPRHAIAPKTIAWLNALFFGAGYALIGQWQKAIVAILIAIAIGPLTLGIGALLLALLTAVDGYYEADVPTRGQWTFAGRRTFAQR